MKIIEYNFEANYLNDYLNLINKNYPEDGYTKIFQDNIRSLLNSHNPYFNHATIKSFIIYEKNVCVGHISAMIDPRLSDKIGLVGFFEVTSDEVAELLLNKAINWLKFQKVKEIRGPINLSIWHNYRFVISSDSNPKFLFEPFNLSNYPEYFKKAGFLVAENYISAYRNEFSSIIAYSKPKYANIKKSDFSIRSINLSDIDSDLKIFYRLSLEVFKNSWSFVPISFEEFASIYKKVGGKISQRYCHFISKQDREVGFCFSIEDHLTSQKTLIMKTIGILPEFQKSNLGSALIYLQTENAIEDGYKRIIYALMRQDNIASNINPYGAKIFRRYKTYNLFL